MPIDPRQQPTTAEGKRADTLASLERRMAAVERGSLNRAISETVAAPWIAPTLLNGYFNHGAGTAPAGYYEDELGRVFLRGWVERGSIPGVPITVFTLAVGYRPAYNHYEHTEAQGGFWDWIVQPDGAVIIGQMSSSLIAILDGVSFRTT